METHRYELTIEYNGEEIMKLIRKGFNQAEIRNSVISWRDKVTGVVCRIPSGSKVKIKRLD